MDDNSWLHLADQDAAWRLPADLAARDRMAARDCGWVEQMRPFIHQFAPPGGIVLDPFCGFASTLVAAHLEGRQGIGVELEPARAALSRERLQRIGATGQVVLTGDVLAAVQALPAVDLVLTNIPYFGCRWPDGDAAQFYAADTYARFLDRFHAVFAALKPVLRDGGYLVAMAENLRIGQHFVPLAWDVARLLAERFELVDERVLVYDKPRHPLEPLAAGSNRAHEFALVARQAPRAIDLADTLHCLQALAAAHPSCIVYGGFARWLLGDEQARPSDADLLVPDDPAQVAAIAAWLRDQGFQVTRWGAPVGAGIAAAASHAAHYLRATRLRPGGALCVIDVCFDDAMLTYDAAARLATAVGGLRVLATRRPAGFAVSTPAA